MEPKNIAVYKQVKKRPKFVLTKSVLTIVSYIRIFIEVIKLLIEIRRYSPNNVTGQLIPCCN